MSWWTSSRFSPRPGMWAAAILSSSLLAVGLLPIWLPNADKQTELARYGNALAHSLALSSAGHLLHKDRIELAVVANRVVALEEVAGVMFFDTGNEIIAISGNSEGSRYYTAPATLDDTITGYTRVILNPQAFLEPAAWWQWLLSLLLVVICPLISLLLLQLSAKGNRSLPIVSVPEIPVVPQTSLCLVANLHNQMALDQQQKRQSIEDALDMAREVCAIHQGLVVEVPLRGVFVLLDRDSLNTTETLSTAFLFSELLSQYETDGEFRCLVSQTTCPGSPTELQGLSREELAQTTDIDTSLTLATLAKPGSLLLTAAVYSTLSGEEQALCEPYSHPLLADLTESPVYQCAQVHPQQQQWVDTQAKLILGFNQASAS